MSSVRAFSLLEVMMACAMVGLLGAGAMSIVHIAGNQTAASRQRARATSDALSTIDRVFSSLGAFDPASGPTKLCELLESADGPMATTTPATASGTCPHRIVAGIPIGNGLQRRVEVAPTTVGAVSGQTVTVIITGDGLDKPVSLSTQLVIPGA